MEITTLETNNNNLKFVKVDDDKHVDDFEKDIEKGDNSKLLSHKSDESDDDQDVVVSTFKRITSPTKNSQQQLLPGNEQTFDKPSDTDSEPDTDAYNFTEDQQRAMMELMAQKQEDVDLLDEEPPEYNVKGRIEQLNAELANDPMPVDKDREPRVGFKPEIVDLVAPPPDYSDDESQANSLKGELHDSTLTVIQKESKGNSDKEEKGSNKEDNVVDLNRKQFVVERDGTFSLLSANELSSSERALFVNDDATEKKVEKQSDNEKIKGKTQSNRSSSAGSSVPSSVASSQVLPRPPSLPRPHTAISGTRRNVHPTQSLQTKPVGQLSNLSSTLDNFNYNSPYAMTPEQKEEAKEKAKKLEEERKEKERKNKEEAEERKRDNDSAFQVWLCKKMEDDRKRFGIEGEKQKSEQERREESEEVYRSWLQEKRAQVKKDKLLKRRQQQEKVEGLVLRSPEECDEAFKEWLKKKNSVSKKQISMERHTNRMYKMQVQRSRKIQALIKALKDSETCSYVDYYGYRF